MQRETRNFRANVATLCTEHGEVQRVATKAGISRVFLSKIIHGKAVPTIEVAAQISDALECPLADLVQDPKEFSSRLAKAS